MKVRALTLNSNEEELVTHGYGGKGFDGGIMEDESKHIKVVTTSKVSFYL